MTLSYFYGNIFLPPGAEVHLQSIMQNIFSISNLIFALRLRRLPLRFDICRSSRESELSSLVDGEDEVKEKSEKREMKNFF